MPGICERCKKSVFHAEEIKAIGKSWHHQCFVCANHGCRKSLDSMNVTERNGEVFCKSCYARLFGPKGYGYAMGAAGSLTLSRQDCHSHPSYSPVRNARKVNLTYPRSVQLSMKRVFDVLSYSLTHKDHSGRLQ